mmetsp:Transcript_39151/g.75964  ORF Transcript_39151/g.75964 Transcript_39151/m.75964 type:complete len:272 (-) Transcript_39151:23-838(-)
MALIYFLLGVISGVFGVIYLSLQRIKLKATQESKTNSDVDRGPVIYLNIVILNKAEVVKQEVEKKLKGALKFFRGAGAHFANKAYTDTKFSQKIGEKLSENIPQKLEEKNIRAKCECVYTEDALCVLALQILKDDINLRAIVEKKVSQKTLNIIDHAMEILGMMGAKEASEEYLKESLCDKIQEKLQTDLPKDLEKKLGDQRGIKVKVCALPEELQASWFFGQLKFMAEAKELEKTRRQSRGILPFSKTTKPDEDQSKSRKGFFPFSRSAR